MGGIIADVVERIASGNFVPDRDKEQGARSKGV